MFSFKDNKVLCGLPEIIAHNCCINLWRAETITMLCHNSCYHIVSLWLHSLCNIISWVIAVHVFFYDHSDSQLLLRCKTSCLMFVWVWLSLVSTNETDNKTDDAPIIQFIITGKMVSQGVDIKRQSIGNQQEQLSDVLLTLQCGFQVIMLPFTFWWWPLNCD